jgi:hypothetical protein
MFETALNWITTHNLPIGYLAGTAFLLGALVLTLYFLGLILASLAELIPKLPKTRFPSHPIVFKIVGSIFILSLAFASNNWVVYLISIIIIATLVTELRFLELLVAMIWNRTEYFNYDLEKLKTSQELESQGSGTQTPQPPENPPNVSTFQELANIDDSSDGAKLKYLILFRFERVYRLIFKSQIDILRILKGSLLPKQVIEDIYKTTKWNGVYTFELYMGFLISNTLLLYYPEQDSYGLTVLGNIFLEYIDYLQSVGMAMNKEGT